MIRNGRHLPILLISLVLLIGQFAAVVHSAEHPFHAQDESCEVFVALERSGNGLVSDCIQIPVLAVHPVTQQTTYSFLLPAFSTSFHSRAPPA